MHARRSQNQGQGAGEMGSNKEYIGKEYPAQTKEFDKALTEGYADATGDDNPRYKGDDGVAPPMAVVAASVPLGLGTIVMDADLIVDQSRLLKLLHGEEEIRWYKSIKPGDSITLTPKVVDIQDKSSGELLIIGSKLENQNGELVAETSSGLFIREKKGAGLKKPDGAKPPQEHGEDFRLEWTVGDDQSIQYAEVSGDRNPIHTNDDVAKMAGLRSKILHGLCTMAFSNRTLVQQYCGGDPARLKRQKVRFTKPVYPGDTLTCVGWVVEKGGEHTTLGFEVLNQDGIQVIKDGVADVIEA
jgi:acyl dehydratase